MADRSQRIEVFPDREALSRAAAEKFCVLSRHAIADHGRFSVALSGGSTPRDFYALLANPETPFRA